MRRHSTTGRWEDFERHSRHSERGRRQPREENTQRGKVLRACEHPSPSFHCLAPAHSYRLHNHACRLQPAQQSKQPAASTTSECELEARLTRATRTPGMEEHSLGQRRQCPSAAQEHAALRRVLGTSPTLCSGLGHEKSVPSKATGARRRRKRQRARERKGYKQGTALKRKERF